MSKVKDPKYKVVNICHGDLEEGKSGTVIRLTEPMKHPESPEEAEAFFDKQGKELGIALLEVLPVRTVSVLVSFLFGVLERTVQQGQVEEGGEEENEDN